MIVTHKIKMDLTHRELPPCIDVVQDDKYSRNIRISLFENGAPFLLPEGCRVQIRYCKSDGMGGLYDTMPDGEDAWSIEENRVTVKLAPQICTTAGSVAMTVSLLHEDVVLSCFELQLRVQWVKKGIFRSLPYENVKGYGAQSDWNAPEGEAGHVLNRTHWTELGMVEPVFDGNISGRENVLADPDLGAYAVKISPQVISLEEMLGSELVLNMEGEEAAIPLTEEMVMDAALALGVPGSVVLLGADPIVLSLAADSTIQGITLSAGTWLMCIPGYIYVKQLSCLKPFEGEIVHKLDRKFLPDDMGSGVGQPGATFRPYVDSEGNLSWTNDQGLANPPTVNIKGETPQLVVEQRFETDTDGFSRSGFIIRGPRIITDEGVEILNEATIWDGKCAYTFAREGGYRGTKDEFAAKLAESLPAVTTEDDGAFLRVVGGDWAAVRLENAEEVTF